MYVGLMVVTGVCSSAKLRDLGRGGNAKEFEKKKEITLLLEERRNKNIFFPLIGVGIGYNFFVEVHHF